MELQNQLTEAANRRDIDTMMSFFAPDAVFDMQAMATYGGGSVEICVRGTSRAVAPPSSAANRRRRTAPRS